MEILFLFLFTFLRRGEKPFLIHLVAVPLHPEKAKSAQRKLILRRDRPSSNKTVRNTILI